MNAIAAFVRKFPRWCIAVLAITILVVVLFVSVRKESGLLRIAFLDVGQGDAVLITAPNGNRLLYDAGPPTHAAVAQLGKELSYFDRNIALMVASHPDADHIGGFVDVLHSFTPLLYLDGHTFSKSADFDVLEQTLRSKHIERRTIGEGARITLGGGVYADVLHPQEDGKNAQSTNDASVVLLLHYGSSTVLLTGDLEAVEESKLVQSFGARLDATILKAGHHGSKSSTSSIFLDATTPEFVVLSVGKNNRYGHPHPATLARLAQSGAQVYSTMEEGTVHFACSTTSCIHVQ